MPKKTFIIVLLVFLILIWGTGWPLITVGLAYCPPLWYSTLRLSIAAILVFFAMLLSGKLIIPNRKDLPFIVSIGLLQMGGFVMLITWGLLYVEPGRSAIIAYTSPFFVTPIAIIYFRETLTKAKLLGLLFGTIGIVLLFSPWEMNWHDKNIIFGNSILLLAAVFWSIGMIHTRFGHWPRPSYLLLPWQLLLSVIPNILMALHLEPHPVIQWHAPMFLFSILFMSLLATVLAYWIVVTITRAMPVITTSLALLAVPVVGLLSSTIIVGEDISKNLMIALGFIIAGLAIVLSSEKKE